MKLKATFKFPEKKDDVKFNIKSYVTKKIDDIFYNIGFTTATHPWKTIFICLGFVIIFALGNLNFHIERDPINLWVPKDSKFYSDTTWLMKNFEEGHREQVILIKANNILEPKNLKKLAILNNELVKFSIKLQNGTELFWSDICFKIPFYSDFVPIEVEDEVEVNDYEQSEDDYLDLENNLTLYIDSNVKRSSEPSVDLDPQLFCSIVNKLPMGCRQTSILEIWNYDIDRISNLSLADVIRAVNKTKHSPVTGQATNLPYLLGGIQRNESGFITSAATLLSNWYVYVNFSASNSDAVGNVAGTENWASEESLLWELKFMEIIEELRPVLEDDNDFKIYYSTERSFGDETAIDAFNIVKQFSISTILMFIYMQFVLSKFSWIEMRFILGTSSLICIGLAIVTTCGIGTLFGLSFGSLHTTFPMLIMGLGVDDMFVMVACWRRVQALHRDNPLPVRMGIMLKQAGVSITVTSITDLVAFLVGSTTIIPSLKIYCLCSTIAVLTVYFLVITLFVAIFTLDEQRIENRKNAIFPCIVHSNTKLCCDQNLMYRTLNYIYSKIILTKPGKIIILIMVVSNIGFSLQNVLKLEKSIGRSWVLNDYSQLCQYKYKAKEFYSEHGSEISVFMGNLNYSAEIQKLSELSKYIQTQNDTLYNINSWVEAFIDFVQLHYNINLEFEIISNMEFHKYLTQFLYSHDGGKYQANFRFHTKLKCGEIAPPINVSSITLNFKEVPNRYEYETVNEIRNMLKQIDFTTGDKFSTIWGNALLNWTFDEIIDVELMKNIGLALICVMLCTFILIIDIQICFWIFVCVLITLINVGGYMNVLGLKIDIISSLSLLLAVGLCVDYTVHVGHTFLMIDGDDRNEKTLNTIRLIGPAIIYGAGSTILAMVMLSTSTQVTSKLFFIDVLIVIAFGVFNGLITLPVILSICGPMSKKETKSVSTKL